MMVGFSWSLKWLLWIAVGDTFRISERGMFILNILYIFFFFAALVFLHFFFVFG